MWIDLDVPFKLIKEKRAYSPPSLLLAMAVSCAAVRSGTASIRRTIQRSLRHSVNLKSLQNLIAKIHRTTLEAHLADDSRSGVLSHLKVLSRFPMIVSESFVSKSFLSRFRLDDRSAT